MCPRRSQTMQRKPRQTELARREFLRGALAASAPLVYGAAGSEIRGGEPAKDQVPARAPGLILREKEPENLEFPFSGLDTFITSNEKFYIRNHFAVPQLDVKSWRLKVEGAVEKPLELRFDEIKAL